MIVFAVASSVASLMASCGAPRKPAPTQPPRVSDSVPERSAALRSAGGVGQEAEDERWGFEAAAERKRREEAARAKASGTVGPVTMPGRDGGTDGMFSK